MTVEIRQTNVMRVDTSDEDLALAAAGGDEAAFVALLERHYDRVFRLAFRLTGQKADAEDLTQDVCAGLPAKLGAYRGNAKLATWLYRVVVNAAQDRRRRAATYARATTSWGAWELHQRAEAVETADQTDWLLEAMGALPDELRDTLALVLDDMTHREAAAVLGVSEGTVSWRISEARKRLKALHVTEDQT